MTRQPSRPTRRASGSSGAAGGLASDRHRPRLPDTELGVDAFDHVAEALQRIESAGGDGNVEIGDGVSLHVSSLDKPYFPDDGVTKGGVMRYYAYLAAAILPSIADRPLVLRRYPAGITGPSFHQHDPGEHTPPGVRVELVPETGGQLARRIVGADPATSPASALATLLYTVQLGALVVNAWHSRITAPEHPDYAVLDLDPQPGVDFASIVQVARHVHASLVGRRLDSVPKTSGSRGIHMLVPLPEGSTFAEATALAEEVAAEVAAEHPELATVERSIDQRPAGTVYVDYMQNSIGKTLAAAFAVRAKPGALVSTPLAWSQVTRSLRPARFNIASVQQHRTKHIAHWREVWLDGA
jgi:bifunctional non-homologous end joining protein LigD